MELVLHFSFLSFFGVRVPLNPQKIENIKVSGHIPREPVNDCAAYKRCEVRLVYVKDTLMRFERNVDLFLNSVVQIEPGAVLENSLKMKTEDCTFFYNQKDDKPGILNPSNEVTFGYSNESFEITHLSPDTATTETTIITGEMSEKDFKRLQESAYRQYYEATCSLHDHEKLPTCAME